MPTAFSTNPPFSPATPVAAPKELQPKGLDSTAANAFADYEPDNDSVVRSKRGYIAPIEVPNEDPNKITLKIPHTKDGEGMDTPWTFTKYTHRMNISKIHISVCGATLFGGDHILDLEKTKQRLSDILHVNPDAITTGSKICLISPDAGTIEFTGTPK